MEVSGQHHTPAAVPPERNYDVRRIWGWEGSKAYLDVLERRKISLRYLKFTVIYSSIMCDGSYIMYKLTRQWVTKLTLSKASDTWDKCERLRAFTEWRWKGKVLFVHYVADNQQTTSFPMVPLNASVFPSADTAYCFLLPWSHTPEQTSCSAQTTPKLS